MTRVKRSETRPGESCVENERAEGESVSVPVYCERSNKPVDPPIIQDKVGMGCPNVEQRTPKLRDSSAKASE